MYVRTIRNFKRINEKALKAIYNTYYIWFYFLLNILNINNKRQAYQDHSSYTVGHNLNP